MYLEFLYMCLMIFTLHYYYCTKSLPTTLLVILFIRFL